MISYTCQKKGDNKMTEYGIKNKIITEIDKLMTLYAKQMDDELYCMCVGSSGSLDNYLLLRAKFKELRRMKEKLLTLDNLEF